MTGWVFESLVLPKDDAAPAACEDRVVVLPPDFAAVIDGATDITGQRFEGRTGGALAAEAIATAFAQGWSHARQGGPDPFATAQAALALADQAIAALYHRLGLAEAAQDPARRFRAAFAVVSLRDGIWRGVGAGDCALRIDDRPPILRDHPAEPVFAAWRAAMIADDRPRSEADIRTTLLGGLARADARARKAAARIMTGGPGDAGLQAGLAGMRAALPGDPLCFGVADGVGDMGHRFCWQIDAAAEGVRALALWTDGWLAPAGRQVDSWIEAARAVHAEDPQRTRRFPCVKGPTASGRHDDLGLVLINRCG
jgi:hypothetical protein